MCCLSISPQASNGLNYTNYQHINTHTHHQLCDKNSFLVVVWYELENVV